MSRSTIYQLRRLGLVVALVACACLLGATLVLAQDMPAGIDAPAGLPGGQVTVTGALLAAIIYLAKRLESRPTAETLARAYVEIDAGRAEIIRLREALDAERIARLRDAMEARSGAPRGGAQ